MKIPNPDLPDIEISTRHFEGRIAMKNNMNDRAWKKAGEIRSDEKIEKVDKIEYDGIPIMNDFERLGLEPCARFDA